MGVVHNSGIVHCAFVGAVRIYKSFTVHGMDIMEVNLYVFSPYRAVNTLRLVYRNQSVSVLYVK
jgi:hypothetical protein